MRPNPIRGRVSRERGGWKPAKKRSMWVRVLSALFLAFTVLCVVLFVNSVVRGEWNVDEWDEFVAGAGIMATLLLFALAANMWKTWWVRLFGSAGLFTFAATLLVMAGVMIVDPWSAIDFGRSSKANFESPGEVRFFSVIWGLFGILLLAIWASRVHDWWQKKRGSTPKPGWQRGAERRLARQQKRASGSTRRKLKRYG